jgi:hypothetical protein
LTSSLTSPSNIDDTQQLPVELAALTVRIMDAMTGEAARFATADKLPQIAQTALNFTRVIDPGNQLPGYEGIWRNAHQARCGSLTFNSDGSFYAEYDLFFSHPTDARWFIEMVTAWGRADSLRAEVQMIPGFS